MRVNLDSELQFMGYYGELDLEIACKAHTVKVVNLLQHNPITGEWESFRQGTNPEVMDITQDEVEMEESAHIVVYQRCLILE